MHLYALYAIILMISVVENGKSAVDPVVVHMIEILLSKYNEKEKYLPVFTNWKKMDTKLEDWGFVEDTNLCTRRKFSVENATRL